MTESDFSKACAAEGLTETVIEDLKIISKNLRSYQEKRRKEKNGKGVSKARILDVAKAADALICALNDLKNGEFLSLENELYKDEFMGLGCDVFSLQRAAGIGQLLGFAQKVVASISASAHIQEAGIESTKGRASNQENYAGYIAGIAHQVMRDGMKVARNGPFERVCNAVYQMAGVPVNPTGHITLFCKEWQSDYRVHGFCL